MASPPTSSAETTVPEASLRRWGILVLVFFVLTSAVGGSLASEGTQLLVTLASHIGLGVVTLGLAGYATSFVGRSYRALPRAFAGLGALAALGATIVGTIFLLDGQGAAALDAMEGLAVVGMVAGLGMVVWGGPSGKRAPAAPTA